VGAPATQGTSPGLLVHWLLDLNTLVLFKNSICSFKIKISNLFAHLQELTLSPLSPHLDLTGMLFLKYLRIDFGAMVYHPQQVQQVQLVLYHF
jgi:hypothetical protein